MVLLALLLLPTFARADAFDSKPINLESAATASADGEAAAQPQTGPSVTRVLGSLALVAALIVGLGVAWKKISATTNKAAGAAAVTMVGRTVLTPRHQVMVLKVGHRLVVVGDAGHGMQPLCEITDPHEVASVLASSGAASADLDPVKAGAFAATLDAAGGYSHEDDDDAHAFEGEADDQPNVESLVGEDVRSLIDRVRGLSVQHAADAKGGAA